MNMVICNVGDTDGTADTGDVIIIPATQKTPWKGGNEIDGATTWDVDVDPLPLAVSTSPYASS